MSSENYSGENDEFADVSCVSSGIATAWSEHGVVPTITVMMLQNKATSICMWCSISTVKIQDTAASVQARRAFLSAGHYAPLQRWSGAKNSHLTHRNLDIGCGEGYYTRSHASKTEVLQCVGVDIAKNAVQVAAKLNPAVTWVVGTGATLPVLEHCIDLCTSLFSPIPQQKFCGF